MCLSGRLGAKRCGRGCRPTRLNSIWEGGASKSELDPAAEVRVQVPARILNTIASGWDALRFCCPLTPLRPPCVHTLLSPTARSRKWARRGVVAVRLCTHSAGPTCAPAELSARLVAAVCGGMSRAASGGNSEAVYAFPLACVPPGVLALGCPQRLACVSGRGAGGSSRGGICGGVPAWLPSDLRGPSARPSTERSWRPARLLVVPGGAAAPSLPGVPLALWRAWGEGMDRCLPRLLASGLSPEASSRPWSLGPAAAYRDQG